MKIYLKYYNQFISTFIARLFISLCPQKALHCVTTFIIHVK